MEVLKQNVCRGFAVVCSGLTASRLLFELFRSVLRPFLKFPSLRTSRGESLRGQRKKKINDICRILISISIFIFARVRNFQNFRHFRNFCNKRKRWEKSEKRLICMGRGRRGTYRTTQIISTSLIHLPLCLVFRAEPPSVPHRPPLASFLSSIPSSNFLAFVAVGVCGNLLPAGEGFELCRSGPVRPGPVYLKPNESRRLQLADNRR